jgi:uncharacterized protein YbjT (DUF2867 family)
MEREILITGATGNVGYSTILELLKLNYKVRAGVRNPERSKEAFENLPAESVELVKFDFAGPHTFAEALDGIKTVFLLRPPQLADVEKYFRPFVEACSLFKVEHIVFLSVQGAEKNSVIPHHKIEKLLEESGLYYTFLRPSYFMQNFLADLHEDLVERGEIYLPAGKGVFNLIDVDDIVRVAAQVLFRPQAHRNKAYVLTGSENLTFGEMSKILGEELDRPIVYRSPNPISFVLRKRNEGHPFQKVLVMLMLHFLPRFSAEPEKTDTLEKLTGNAPLTFREFVNRNRRLLEEYV